MGHMGNSAQISNIVSNSSFCVNQVFKMSDPFPEIKSKHSLVAKYVTQPIWEKLSRAVTKTSGFSLAQAIPVTWMLPRSMVTLTHLHPSTPPVSGLEGPLMDLVFPPESPRNRELVLRTS